LIKKKIVIVGPAYPYRGGNALYVSSVFDILKNDYDVKIINYKLLYPSLLFPGTTQKDVSNKIIKKAESLRIINSINPLTWFHAAKVIKNEKPDLIIFDWWNPFFGPSHYVISKLLKKNFGNKILFITENVISHEGRFFDRVLTRIGIKNASMFMALSDVVEETLKNFSNGRKVYKSALPVYDCYNMNSNAKPSEIKSQLNFGEKDIILLFFGYVRKYKGLNVLIDAMPEIIKKNPVVKLLIVGEFYDSSEKYYKQINELNINNNVKVIEKFVPNEDVGNYYSICDIVILPYLEATQSGVLNIAYGFNKPVIVTDVGGLKEDVLEGKTGYVIEAGNPLEISNAVEKFLIDRKSVNFSENISGKLEDNEFNKLPLLIEKIINEI
jgi:glycosyltransferase involved in cell wall biosynthesis